MGNQEDIPQYRKIYTLLRKHILEGVYKEGSILPSENEICKLHNITRPTVRRALDALVNEGYIVKQQGKGSIVNYIPKEIGILSIAGTTSVIGEKHLQTQIITKPELRPFSQPFHFTLSTLELESGCIFLERLRLLDNRPIFYDTNYIPNINLPRFCNRSFENRSLFELLRNQYEIEIKGGEQRLRAIPADTRIARFLKITKGQPVLHLERKLSTNKSGFNIYSSLYCNTEEHTLHGIF